MVINEHDAVYGVIYKAGGKSSLGATDLQVYQTLSTFAHENKEYIYLTYGAPMRTFHKALKLFERATDKTTGFSEDDLAIVRYPKDYESMTPAQLAKANIEMLDTSTNVVIISSIKGCLYGAVTKNLMKSYNFSKITTADLHKELKSNIYEGEWYTNEEAKHIVTLTSQRTKNLNIFVYNVNVFDHYSKSSLYAETEASTKTSKTSTTSTTIVKDTYTREVVEYVAKRGKFINATLVTS